MGVDVVMNSLAITQVIVAIIASIQNSNSLTEVCFHRMIFIVADESVAYYYLIKAMSRKIVCSTKISPNFEGYEWLIRSFFII